MGGDLSPRDREFESQYKETRWIFFAFLYKVVFMFEKKTRDEPSEAGYGVIF